jgi:hypothetical protein
MGGPAAVFAVVVGHVRRARVDQQEAQLTRAGWGRSAVRAKVYCGQRGTGRQAARSTPPHPGPTATCWRQDADRPGPEDAGSRYSDSRRLAGPQFYQIYSRPLFDQVLWSPQFDQILLLPELLWQRAADGR